MKKFLTAAMVALAATTAFAQVDTSRTVVVINGEEVKGGEYYHRMEYLPGVGKPMGKAFSEFPPGFLTIEQLITERLVFQLAKEKGVMPTDMEVDAEYRARKEDTPNLDTIWTVGGRTLEDLKYQIKYELCQFKIQTFGVTVTNQEIDTFYKTHPDDFKIPKRVKLRVVAVLSDADKSAVDKALSSGTPFADVATKYSVDLTKARGGEYGTMPVTMLATAAKDAIDATKIGGMTTWVTTQQGDTPVYLKFLVEDVKKEESITLDDKVRRQVRRKLMMDKGGAKNNIEKEMKAMRVKSKIDIKQPEFAAAYKTFIESYLREGGN